MVKLLPTEYTADPSSAVLDCNKEDLIVTTLLVACNAPPIAAELFAIIMSSKIKVDPETINPPPIEFTRQFLIVKP
jgi:hypothetical protein